MKKDFLIENGELFSYIGSDTNVIVPDTVKLIKNSAFENNQTVETIIIPSGTKCEPNAFQGCDKLKYTVTQTVYNAFECKEPTLTKPLFNNKSIIHKIFADESALRTSKYMIQDYFENYGNNSKSCIEFCKTVFENCYIELFVDNERYGYKPYENGLLVWEGLYPKRETEVFYTWEDVSNIYSDMVNKNKLFSKQELQEMRNGVQLSFFDLIEQTDEVEMSDKYEYADE